MQPLRLMNIMVAYAAPIGIMHTAGVSLTGAATGGGPVLGGGGAAIFVGPTYTYPITHISKLFGNR